jgi:hypothetical protein
MMQTERLRGVVVPKTLKIVPAGSKGFSLVANRKFRLGEKVCFLAGELVDAAHSTPEAVQISDTQFIDTNYLVAEDFINHSCSPNTRLDIECRQFTALRDISRGEEITYHYLTTEWDMEAWGADFRCACGSLHCLGHIRGFKYLPLAEKLRIKPLLSPLLRGKLEEIERLPQEKI